MAAGSQKYEIANTNVEVTYQTSAYITRANVSLSKISHVATLGVNVTGHSTRTGIVGGGVYW